jgi:excisionase family DNA binding protein
MRQASERLGGVPSAETLYRLAREGHLPVKVIGRRVVISDSRLDEWANEPGDARSRSYNGSAT